MPAAPKRPCSVSRCPEYQPCPKHSVKSSDTKTSEERRLYSSWRWTQASKRFRERNVICGECGKIIRPSERSVTDHKVRYRDGADFWDEANWQALHERCHQQKRRRERETSTA